VASACANRACLLGGGSGPIESIELGVIALGSPDTEQNSTSNSRDSMEFVSDPLHPVTDPYGDA
jgi:hypothetical protein